MGGKIWCSIFIVGWGAHSSEREMKSVWKSRKWNEGKKSENSVLFYSWHFACGTLFLAIGSVFSRVDVCRSPRDLARDIDTLHEGFHLLHFNIIASSSPSSSHVVVRIHSLSCFIYGGLLAAGRGLSSHFSLSCITHADSADEWSEQRRLGEMKRKSRAVARLQSSKLPPQTGKTTSSDMKRDLIRTHHLMLFVAMLLSWWKIILNGRLSRAQM